MRKIYIIATNNSTVPSKLFKLFTNVKYVHISIALDKKLKRVYSFGRKKVNWILPAGFVEEDYEIICGHCNNSICRVYELEITSKQYHSLKRELRTYRKDALKYRYNIMGLPMLNFKLAYHRRYHYVCSQFCGKLLSDAGVYDFKKDYSILKPKDFFEIEGTKLIYEGKTFDYIKELI